MRQKKAVERESMAKKSSRLLVVDASIARSSGGEDAIFPTSKKCRDFLSAIRRICRKIVMTPDLSDEWRKHQSNFARIWRVSMEARRKVEHINNDPNDELRRKIESNAASEEGREAMLKDIHLIEAAMETDSLVSSLDETARNLFGTASSKVGEINNIVWANPDKVEDDAISWLENGAKSEMKRRLGHLKL